MRPSYDEKFYTVDLELVPDRPLDPEPGKERRVDEEFSLQGRRKGHVRNGGHGVVSDLGTSARLPPRGRVTRSPSRGVPKNRPGVHVRKPGETDGWEWSTKSQSVRQGKCVSWTVLSSTPFPLTLLGPESKSSRPRFRTQTVLSDSLTVREEQVQGQKNRHTSPVSCTTGAPRYRVSPLLRRTPRDICRFRNSRSPPLNFHRTPDLPPR